MRILVTGSEGFVGKHLCKELIERRHKVFRADKRIGSDLSYDYEARIAMESRPDAVIHLAASCSTPASLKSPLQTYRDTVQTAVNVAYACIDESVPFLLTSSVKARDGMTPYGASKCMSEAWALEMRRSFGLPIVINRPGTIYGPGQEGSPESGWIAWFLKAARTGERVTINGTGDQERDLLHVSDYVSLLVRQVEHVDQYEGEYVWDVGGGPQNTVTVNTMARILGLDFEYGPPRSGDADSYVGVNDAPFWSPIVYWRHAEVFS